MMEPDSQTVDFKTDCPVCKSLGPVTFTGFKPLSHGGRCFREVRARQDGRLKSIEMFLFEISGPDDNLKVHFYDPDKDDLALVLHALDGSFLSHSARKALKRGIRDLPPKTIHDFLQSGHEERWDLFALLDRIEIQSLNSFQVKYIQNRINFENPPLKMKGFVQYTHQIYRFALFVFYFRKDLYKRGIGRHYFGQKAPSPIDVYSLPPGKSARDLVIIHHLKRPVQIEGKTHYIGTAKLGSGSEHKVRLSLKVHVKSKKMTVCATSTPRISSRSEKMSEIETMTRSMYIDDFLKNTERWTALCHLTPHIVKPLHMSQFHNKKGESHANVVMEFGEQTLEQRILYGKCSLQDYHDLLEGLSTIHAKGYFSLDIKIQNTLYVDGKIKFIDVGSALPIGVYGFSHVFSNGYQPVEMIQNQKAHFTPAVDVFTLGIVFYAMRYRVEPSFCEIFDQGESQDNMMKAFDQFHSNFQPEEGDVLGSVIKRMLCGNPKKRIGAKEALDMLLSNQKDNKRTLKLGSNRIKKKRTHGTTNNKSQ